MDRTKLLSQCGVSASDPVEPGQMVADDLHYGLWETILSTLSLPGFPIRYAQTIRADHYGAFGLAIKTAPTVGDSLRRAHRYLAVLTDTSWLELRDHGRQFEVLFQRQGARRLGMRCANEAALGEMVEITREISGVRFQPLAVSFRHAAPSSTDEHEQFFGCPVRFEQATDSLLFDSSVMALPLLKADRGLSQFVTNHLDDLVSTSTTPSAEAKSLEQSLKRQIRDALPDGVPNMAEVAKRLGMSRRTLARRLSESKTTFQTLVESTRRTAAQQMLEKTPHSLAEISFLLGFSEQSAFQRAFKRWTGETPADFRRELAAQ